MSYRMSKWGVNIIPHLIDRFKKQNEEILPLIDRLNLEVVKPMLRGDTERIKQLKAANIGRVAEVQNKIDALLSSTGPAPAEGTTTTEDVAMADA